MSTRPDSENRGTLGPEGYSDTTAIPPLEDLGGMEVRDVNGEKVGKVEDAYVDADTSYVRYLAVSTGWFGTKRHMVPVDDVRMERAEGDDYLVVPYDRDHMRDAPSFERDEAFSREQEYRTYGHYGRTGYWDALRARQSTPAATPEIAEREERTGDDLKARQTAPAPTPEIAQAEIDAAIDRGEDPNQVAVKRWGV